MLKRVTSIVLAITISLSLFACNSSIDKNAIDPADKIKVNIGALKGPTGLGMLKLMDDAADFKTTNNYEFTLVGDPSELVAKLSSKQLDIASLPTNVASTLYNKTNSNIQILNINTLGVLYILENGENMSSISDLKGKTIYATGQGATPEYALSFILEQNGLKVGDDVFIEYLSEHSELATKLIAGDASIAMLPEPFVTQVTNKNSNIKVAIDLTSEWDKVVDSQSVLSMGCLIARRDFAEQNKDVIDNLMNEYKESIDYTNNNLSEAALLSEKYDIMPAEIAKEAIPNCNIVYVEGEDMKNKCLGFLDVLYRYNPRSVGGSLPGEDFYYQK